jgi:subtilase family serine protease
MCGTYKPTNVISVSYGGQEADLPISYQKRQCLEYMKLGLQGVSFLFASGDSGVSSKGTIPISVRLTLTLLQTTQSPMGLMARPDV